MVIALLGGIMPAAASSAPAPVQESGTSTVLAADSPDVASLLSGLRSAGQAVVDRLSAAVTPSGSSLTLGSDGRLTFLLVGSDYRPGYTDERLDVILVVSIDTSTGKVVAASIPRDTVQFPRAPSNGGGTSGNERVNYMLEDYSGTLTTKLQKFTKDVSFALGVEIDHYGYLQFTGFDHLMVALGGVTVNIAQPITDKNYNDYGSPPFGIHFPAASSYYLGGPYGALCPDWHSNCHRAQPYVRSRHGKVGNAANNDWKRNARQQQVVMAAMQQVTSGHLSALVNAANAGMTNGLTTDVAISLANARQLYNWVHDATFSHQVIFQPNTWETHHQGTPAYTYTLRLSKVRAWIHQYMPALTP